MNTAASKSSQLAYIMYYCVLLQLRPSQEAVKFLITKLSEVSKTRHLTVKILSADFAAASENSGKNLCCLLKIDITFLRQ